MRKFSLLLLLGVAVIFVFGFVNNGGKNANTPAANSTYAAPAGGTMSGTVTYAGTAAAPKKLEVTKDVAVCGKEGHVDESLLVGANKGIQNVVVSIKGVKGGKGMETLGANFMLDQKVCAYKPHVLVVPINVPVKIINSDGILHNIHTYGKKNPPKNMAQPKFKKELTETFTQAEAVPVKCDVHGWMSAWIVAVDHPYYAVTDANGKFTITDVPAGTYTIEYWQEKLGVQTKQITVAASGATTADFVYPAGK